MAARWFVGNSATVGGIEEFCRSLRPGLLGVLTVQYGHHVAEELTQETLARVYAHWEQVRQARSPQAWAYRVAFNLARCALRRKLAERRAMARVGTELATAAPGLDPADVLALRSAIGRLPKRQRTALVLRYYADLSVAEVAEVMGCSVGTVKSTTHDAVRALRFSAGGYTRGRRVA